MMNLTAIILAAGKGKRMNSRVPKPLHCLSGKPLLLWVIDAAYAAGAARVVVVVGDEAEDVSEYLKNCEASQHIKIETVTQSQQLGTGHAVEVTAPCFTDKDEVAVIAFADTPLISADTIHALATSISDDGNDVSCLGFSTPNPTGYGRIIRDEHGTPTQIVEEGDASDQEKAITFVNSGLMAVRLTRVFDLLSKIETNSKTGENFLTDIIAAAHAEKLNVGCLEADHDEVMGINTRIDLAKAEAIVQNSLRQRAMQSGVTLLAPETVFFHHDTVIESDVIIHPHVIIGEGTRISEGAEIKSFSHIEGASIGACAVIGPFARLRPGTVLAEGVRVGNFVETKNTTMGAMAKANHLTYLGDATIGERANIGAGTITCNYNGLSKSETTIGNDAFIGSNTALVAPVKIGDEAIIGAGSTITKDVPSDALAVERSKTKTIAKGAKAYRKKHGA